MAISKIGRNATDTGITDSSDATAITIDSAENVGIGQAPETSHHANWTAVDIGNRGGIAQYKTTGDVTLTYNLYHDGAWKAKETAPSGRYVIGEGPYHIWYTGASASADASVTLTERMRLTGDGLHLGGTGSANAIDDYEEGTWDVAVACGTSGSITIRSDYNEGYYNKVGTLVHAQGYIVVSGVSSPSGYISIGLPFAAANTSSEGGDWSAASVTVQGSAKNVNQMNATLIPGGSQSIYVYASDAVTLQADSAEAIAADDSIYFSCTYRSA